MITPHSHRRASRDRRKKDNRKKGDVEKLIYSDFIMDTFNKVPLYMKVFIWKYFNLKGYYYFII